MVKFDMQIDRRGVGDYEHDNLLSKKLVESRSVGIEIGERIGAVGAVHSEPSLGLLPVEEAEEFLDLKNAQSARAVAVQCHTFKSASNRLGEVPQDRQSDGGGGFGGQNWCCLAHNCIVPESGGNVTNFTFRTLDNRRPPRPTPHRPRILARFAGVLVLGHKPPVAWLIFLKSPS